MAEIDGLAPGLCGASAGVDSRPPTVDVAGVSLRGVSVVAGGVRVLDGVDLWIPLSERTVIVGPNGAGKTTLLKVLHQLVHPTGGEFAVTAPAGGRRTFAYVFQSPVMLRRSARANVEHVLRLAGVSGNDRMAKADAALAEVGLGYAADRSSRRLSGGEQQRLSIARANALDPACLLLDEPTSNLDPGAAAAIERHLLDLSTRGRGIVMTTHNLAQARRVAERIVFMHRGQVLESARAEEFFARPRHDAARRFLSGEWID